MIDDDIMERAGRAVAAALAEDGILESERRGRRFMAVSMRTLLTALATEFGATPTADQALFAAQALQITASMGTVHRHMVLHRERLSEEASSQASAGEEAAASGSVALPAEVAARLSSARATFEGLETLIADALAAERRGNQRSHFEELERTRVEHVREVAALRDQLAEVWAFAEECSAETDDYAEITADLEARNAALAREVADLREDQNKLEELNAGLRIACNGERGSAVQALAASKAQEQRILDLAGRVQALGRECHELRGASKAAGEARAARKMT